MRGRTAPLDLCYLRWAARNWTSMAGVGLNPGPFAVRRLLRRHPWIHGMLKVNNLMARLMGSRRGPYREATGYMMSKFAEVLGDMVRNIHLRPDRLIWHEDMVPPEIFFAMDLQPYMIEMMGIVLPMMDPDLAEMYIDESENAGIPPDVCTLPRLGMGMALAGHLPHPLAIVASNSPCDGGMASYSVLQQISGAPTFRLDLPYRYDEESAIDYYVGELKEMIAFLEEHTPGRLDWDRLKEVCEERNRAMVHELDLWDMLRSKPAPIGSDVVFLSNLIFFQVVPGTPTATKAYAQLVEYARQAREQSGPESNEKYRVLLWNPPTLVYPELFGWAEREFGATMVMDMLSFHRNPFVDTSSRESMLRGLARIFMAGPMARHTRGPVEIFFDDMFTICEQFSIDTIWMAAHLACKNTQALLGMMREKCRERGIPLLAIDYDLADSRVVSPEGIKEQVATFVETVLER